MFSIQVFEAGREPLRLDEVPPAVVSWLQHMGGWAAFFLILWLLAGYTRMRATDKARIPRWESRAILFLAWLSAAAFALGGGMWVIAAFRDGVARASDPPTWSLQSLSLAAGGLCAILAVCLPILRNLLSLRWRRIWALTRLSFKESIRSRALYAFSALLVVFLFASWFIPYKPESQVRNYVHVVYLAMAILLLFTAAILSAFSLPTDVKNQTIHTIVTKPVERFEVLLGRFFGFTLLMTVVLAVMTTLSLVYVLRGVDPAAAAESLKARDPLYGNLYFETPAGSREQRATNVGREWDYRSHITGSSQAPGLQAFAVWEFPSVPNNLASRPRVRCEFAFDIYRTTKGQENRGIPCDFTFMTAQFVKGQENDYQRERDKLLREGGKEADVDNELARKYGYYKKRQVEVFDFHTQSFDVPGGLFESALAPVDRKSAPGREPPPLRVRVECTSRSQFVGMAQYDLYLRTDDPEGGSDRLWFALNFYKGALGLWMRLCLLIGLAVCLSTYLSGVISFLVALILYMCGTNLDFIRSVAFGKAPEGGPILSLVHLARREVGIGNLSPESTAARVAEGSDVVFRWVFRRFLDWVPDIDRFDLKSYVGEGFNVPWLQLLLSVGMLVAYLLPWIVLGYYLIKWREVASSS
jgi:hypothetical protein